MLNQLILVGRMKEIKKNETESGKKMITLTLAVPRNFKNMNGEYETDFIPCILWNDIARNAEEYLKTGDVIGIKGRIQMYKNNIEVICEKLTFLSSKKEGEE